MKCANFNKIKPIAPDKRALPKLPVFNFSATLSCLLDDLVFHAGCLDI